MGGREYVPSLSRAVPVWTVTKCRRALRNEVDSPIRPANGLQPGRPSTQRAKLERGFLSWWSAGWTAVKFWIALEVQVGEIICERSSLGNFESVRKGTERNGEETYSLPHLLLSSV